MEERRLFVAASLSEEAIQALTALQEAGQAAEVGNQVRWLPAENMHITLHFIGDTPTDRVDAADKTLSGIPQRESIRLRLSHAGTFPGPKRPRVLWAGFDSGSDALTRLANDLSAALAKAGFPEPDKPFKAHVTIGYIRKQTHPAAARRIFQEITERTNGILGDGIWSEIAEYSLVESELRKSGAKHTVVKSYRFG